MLQSMCTLPCLQETLVICGDRRTSSEWKSCYNNANEKCVLACISSEGNKKNKKASSTSELLAAVKKLKAGYEDMKEHDIVVDDE